jgi:hypothetical protein
MRPEAELDIECFHNWFLVGITDRKTKVEWDYQLTPGAVLDTASITALLMHYTVVTFNGKNYDDPMLMLALTGADNAALKSANDDIILRGMKPWQFYKKFNCWPPAWFDSIDVAEPTPGVKVSLKQYACRMHSKLVMDSPVNFNLPLPLEHAPEEIFYCRNDRGVTGELRDVISDRIDLRYRMSERYGIDLRSKSDAQMAEAMVKVEWQRRMRESIEKEAAELNGAIVDSEPCWHNTVDYSVDYKGNLQVVIPKFAHGTKFKTRIPDYVQFVTPAMQQFLQTVRDCDFEITDKEEAALMGYDGKTIKTGVVIPPELKGRDIVINQTKYRVGIGGLHSQESSVSYRSIPGVQTLRTIDVKSYYPSLIINSGMYPAQLGPLFQVIYKTIYVERLAAKDAAKKIAVTLPQHAEIKAVEGGFKIVLNGTFGKLFSRFSIFYSPEMGIYVTIGGQLSLLMLAERLELAGIRVVSANTDGMELLIPFGYEHIADSIVAWWEKTTRLEMEGSNYLALHSRDVNNYVSIGFDGSVKRKGVFGRSGVISPDAMAGKHPDLDICSDAVVDYLSKGTPLAQTIMGCRDIRKFLRVRGAKGGAVLIDGVNSRVSKQMTGGFTKDWTPEYRNVIEGAVSLGRAVRWYYGNGCTDYIADATSGSKVAGSDGARLVMKLPLDMPLDVDYSYYITNAEQMLIDLGVTP